MSEEENKAMDGTKWVGLDEPIDDCRCCIHQDECAPLKQHVSQKHLNGNYRFRCPILIEVDENIEYSSTETKQKSGKGKRGSGNNRKVYIPPRPIV